MKVLFLHAGSDNFAGLKGSLEALQLEWGYYLHLRCHDLCSHNEGDWADIEVLMESWDVFGWDFVIAVPPYSTFARARNRFVGRAGPRPLRSRLYPFGFPWLEAKPLASCEAANLALDRTFAVLQVAAQAKARFLLMAPEDLGRSASGVTPASIWQLEETQSLLVEGGASTWAFFQCSFGGTSARPMRGLGNIQSLKEMRYSGWPYFDDSERYLGPLPSSCPHGGHKPLTGVEQSSLMLHFAVCEFLALLLVKSFVGLTLKKGEVRSGTRAGLTEPSWGIASGNPCPVRSGLQVWMEICRWKTSEYPFEYPFEYPWDYRLSIGYRRWGQISEKEGDGGRAADTLCIIVFFLSKARVVVYGIVW
jgi:hypothetical protein